MLYRTIVEAAKEMEPAEALELLLTYADYALGDTDEIKTDNKYIGLIIKQVVPSLNAAENRYQAAVENGKKGADAGKEKGGGIGRRRKDETPEEYQKRVEEWRTQKTPSKTPRITPQNPQNNLEKRNTPKPPENPQDVDVDVDIDVYVDNSLDNILNTKDTQVIPKGTTDTTEEDKKILEKYYYNLNVERILERISQSGVTDEEEFNKDALNFIDEEDNYAILSNYLEYWSQGGFDAFLELTNGLPCSVRREIIRYIKVARARNKELAYQRETEMAFAS